MDQETEEVSRLRDRVAICEREAGQYHKNLNEREYAINELERKLSRSESVKEEI